MLDEALFAICLWPLSPQKTGGAAWQAKKMDFGLWAWYDSFIRQLTAVWSEEHWVLT